MSTVTTKCPKCGAVFQTEYQRIGAPVTCGNCHKSTVPQIPTGTQIPCQVWDLTYQDFQRLVEDDTYRTEIAPLLEQWFGYRLVGAGPGTLIVDQEKQAIAPLWLHLEIQGNPDKQYKLYQTAMSLWR